MKRTLLLAVSIAAMLTSACSTPTVRQTQRQMTIAHRGSSNAVPEKTSASVCSTPAARQTQMPMVIAHRGSSDAAPENTLASALLAWRQNADAVEVDIRLSKDNRLMVIHDETTERTAGVDMKISETSSAKLRKLDVGSHKSKKYAGERIPFLEEIIDTVPPGKKLFVEVKSDAKTLPYLKEIVEKSGKADQIIIIGFDLEDMAAMKRLTPEIPVYWLNAAKEDKATKEYIPYDPDVIAITKESDLDALNLFYKGITEQFADQAKKHNLPLYTWTVDDLDIAKKMKALGIKGITTNTPKAIKTALQ